MGSRSDFGQQVAFSFAVPAIAMNGLDGSELENAVVRATEGGRSIWFGCVAKNASTGGDLMEFGLGDNPKSGLGCLNLRGSEWSGFRELSSI